jgi:hypothetical protein
MDRFSFITLALTLRALMAIPSLYNEYAVTDENLIFQASDYKEPGNSRAFLDLKYIGEIRSHVMRFEELCRGPVEAVPTLEEFVQLSPSSGSAPSGSRDGRVPKVNPKPSPAQASPIGGFGSSTTILASDYEQVGRHATSKSPITIVGAVHSCRALKDGYRLYFSDCTLSGVVVTLKDAAEDKYRRIATDCNQHVVITSRVREVRPRYTTATSQESVHVHMVISDPSAIRCVSATEAAIYSTPVRNQASGCGGNAGEPRPPPVLDQDTAETPQVPKAAHSVPNLPVEPIATTEGPRSSPTARLQAGLHQIWRRGISLIGRTLGWRRRG